MIKVGHYEKDASVFQVKTFRGTVFLLHADSEESARKWMHFLRRKVKLAADMQLKMSQEIMKGFRDSIKSEKADASASRLQAEEKNRLADHKNALFNKLRRERNARNVTGDINHVVLTDEVNHLEGQKLAECKILRDASKSFTAKALEHARRAEKDRALAEAYKRAENRRVRLNIELIKVSKIAAQTKRNATKAQNTGKKAGKLLLMSRSGKSRAQTRRFYRKHTKAIRRAQRLARASAKANDNLLRVRDEIIKVRNELTKIYRENAQRLGIRSMDDLQPHALRDHEIPGEFKVSAAGEDFMEIGEGERREYEMMIASGEIFTHGKASDHKAVFSDKRLLLQLIQKLEEPNAPRIHPQKIVRNVATYLRHDEDVRHALQMYSLKNPLGNNEDEFDGGIMSRMDLQDKIDSGEVFHGMPPQEIFDDKELLVHLFDKLGEIAGTENPLKRVIEKVPNFLKDDGEVQEAYMKSIEHRRQKQREEFERCRDELLQAGLSHGEVERHVSESVAAEGFFAEDPMSKHHFLHLVKDVQAHIRGIQGRRKAMLLRVERENEEKKLAIMKSLHRLDLIKKAQRKFRKMHKKNLLTHMKEALFEKATIYVQSHMRRALASLEAARRRTEMGGYLKKKSEKGEWERRWFWIVHIFSSHQRNEDSEQSIAH
jgi:hypothetical protein